MRGILQGFILLAGVMLLMLKPSGSAAMIVDSLSVHADSLHTAGDSMARKAMGDTLPADAKLIQKLEHFALKNNLLSKLLRSVMVIHHESAPKDTTTTSDKPYRKYSDRTIRNIEIVVLDPFGYTVHEMVNYKPSTLEKLGNIIHYNTRTWVVKNKLLFEPGDSMDDFKVSESERLLRSSAYILDARVRIMHEDTLNKTVDLMVIVQDIFSMGAAASGDPKVPNGDVTINDNNFIGLGQKMEAKVWYDQKYYSNWKFSGQYFVPEIANTYISARLFYTTMNFDRRYGISLGRGFYSATTRLAGGLDLFNIKEEYNTTIGQENVYHGINTYNYRDGWLGYAFKPKLQISERQKKSQLIVSGRVVNRQYLNRDNYEEALGHFYQDNLLFLGGVGYSFREYYKDRYVFGFGRTEDIPLGYLMTFTAGMDYSTYQTRPYSGIKAAYGWNNSSLGYMFMSLEGGSFLNGNRPEQGVVAAELQYWTNMLHIGPRWMVRQFWWNRLSLGYNRRPGELLNINNTQGLRVFNGPMSGTQKLVSNYEMDIYSPWKPFGFKMVGVLFVDFAMLGTQQQRLLNSRVFQGYGIGLRLKNEHLIFKTFQISIHYYPGATDWGINEFRYDHTEHGYYRSQGFEFNRPYTVPF